MVVMSANPTGCPAQTVQGIPFAFNAPEPLAAPRRQAGCENRRSAVTPARACSLKTKSVCPWRRPSRHAVGTNCFLVGVSRPRAVPDVVTGRTTHERCAVLESQFAALKVKRARASEALLRGPPGARRSLGRAGADYWPHNIVIGSVGAHARQSAARERHRCARLRRACGR
jgi:hypothetical protein